MPISLLSHGMLEQVSEAHDASSWPFGCEDQLRQWVASGDYRDPPLELGAETGSPEFFARLVYLQRAAGNGWPYYVDALKRVVWIERFHKCDVKPA
jgi:hypothetical protein